MKSQDNTYQQRLKDHNEFQEPLLENVHYYWENGLCVFTEKYLKDRGYCCQNKCRHCPYTCTIKK